METTNSLYEVPLPGIITGEKLAEVREGFTTTIAGLRLAISGWDNGVSLHDAGTTTFLFFKREIDAAMFKLMRG